MSPDLERVARRHGVLVLVLAAAGWAAGGPGPGGVLLGGAVIAGSLALSAVGFRALASSGRRRLAITVLFVKLSLLFGLTGMVLAAREQGPDPLGFVLGVSCLPAGAVWEALAIRQR